MLIIALFCINIALFMQKNFVLHIANLAIMAAIAIITNLGFICMTLGAVCGKAKTIQLSNLEYHKYARKELKIKNAALGEPGAVLD